MKKESFYHNGGQTFEIVLEYSNNDTNQKLVLGRGLERAPNHQRKRHIEEMDYYYYSYNQYHVFYGDKNDPIEGYGFTKLSHRKSKGSIGEANALKAFFKMVNEQKFITYKKLKL